MPRRVNIAGLALNQTPLDWNGNQRRIEAALDESRSAGAHVVLFPELAITGYGCEDVFLAPATADRALETLLALAPTTHDLIAIVGLPLATPIGLLNTAAVLANGVLRGCCAKRVLAREGLHYEPRWFTPCPPGTVFDLRVGDRDVPVGDLVFTSNDVTIGIEICEDAWAATRPALTFPERGVNLVLNPSASHFAIDKIDDRVRLIEAGSEIAGAPYVYANLLGNEAGRAIYDGGVLAAMSGRITHRGPRLRFTSRCLSMVQLDLPSPPPSTDHGPAPGKVDLQWSWPDADPTATCAPSPWDGPPHRAPEELGRSIALALFDYLRKSRAQGYVISLSGGADSAAVACCCWLMVQLGVAELGGAGFRAALGHIALPETDDCAELTGALLTCVYQATRNSSEQTTRAARELAAALNARFHEVAIDAVVDTYVNLGEAAEGRSLEWETDDVTLQNIQARARGPFAWLLANLRGAVLLSTSNRSEASVGYATMDGDTCGGLCPIAGVDKATLRVWLSWLRDVGPNGIGPVPALGAILDQAPTAELRPPGAAQTDEEDLMPYPVLDHIERLAIGKRMTPLAVFQALDGVYPYDTDTLAHWIERFYRLWAANQWKRERFAPSFHVDDQSVDPKTWCRFPILSGGFARELAELADHVGGLT